MTTHAASGSLITLTATSGTISGTYSFTVDAATPVSVAITPANYVVAVTGTVPTYVATATYTDGSTTSSSALTWTSSDITVATVDGAGATTLLKAGSTTIGTTYLSITASTTLTVNDKTLTSIVVTSSAANVVAGRTVQLTATGHYSDSSTADITNSVTWSSLLLPVPQ